ncbi:MAG TPA: 50S ribosomal protein L21 [Patescibacteria group bacterium]
MKYAVIKSGGKQYKVSEGDTVVVDKLGLKPSDSYTFESVLLFVDGDKRQFGTPNVEGVVVVGSVLDEKKQRKVRVAKFKAKARYRKVIGHRSIMTSVKVTSISTKNTKSASAQKSQDKKEDTK